MRCASGAHKNFNTRYVMHTAEDGASKLRIAATWSNVFNQYKIRTAQRAHTPTSTVAQRVDVSTCRPDVEYSTFELTTPRVDLPAADTILAARLTRPDAPHHDIPGATLGSRGRPRMDCNSD